jgi:hypothetical protein
MLCVCTACEKGPCTHNCNTTEPIFHEYIPGDELYQDPMGEPYKGLTEFILTPLDKPRTADELLKEKIKRSTTTLIDSL